MCLKLHTAVLAGHGVCGDLALPPSLSEAMQAALGTSLHSVFWLMLLVAFAGFLLATRMPNKTPLRAREAVTSVTE